MVPRCCLRDLAVAGFPSEIDLGVGVYKDEAGHTPILESVKRAEQLRLDSETTKTYHSPAGGVQYLHG